MRWRDEEREKRRGKNMWLGGRNERWMKGERKGKVGNNDG